PLDLPRTVLVEMLLTPDNEPTLTIDYSGVQTANTDCVSMFDPATGNPITLGCLDPTLTTRVFPTPESLPSLTNEIDITNNDAASIQILSKDFFTGEIPVLPTPDECHQGDFPGFAFLVRSFGKVGNGAEITGNIGVNDLGGRFLFGKDVFVTD